MSEQRKFNLIWLSDEEKFKSFEALKMPLLHKEVITVKEVLPEQEISEEEIDKAAECYALSLAKYKTEINHAGYMSIYTIAAIYEEGFNAAISELKKRGAI